MSPSSSPPSYHVVGAGLSVGIVCSLLLFKSKQFPSIAWMLPKQPCYLIVLRVIIMLRFTQIPPPPPPPHSPWIFPPFTWIFPPFTLDIPPIHLGYSPHSPWIFPPFTLDIPPYSGQPWPIALGTGFGLGYAASNCQHDFKRLDSVHLKPIKVRSDV